MLPSILRKLCSVDSVGNEYLLSLRFHTADFIEKREFLSLNTVPQKHTDCFLDDESFSHLKKKSFFRKRDDGKPVFQKSEHLLPNCHAYRECAIAETQELCFKFRETKVFLNYDFERYSIDINKADPVAKAITAYVDRIVSPLMYELITVKHGLECFDENYVLGVLSDILVVLGIHNPSDLKCTHSKFIYILRCSDKFYMYNEIFDTDIDTEVYKEVVATIQDIEKKEDEEDDDDHTEDDTASGTAAQKKCVKRYLWENGRQIQYFQRVFSYHSDLLECYDLVTKYRKYVLENQHIHITLTPIDY